MNTTFTHSFEYLVVNDTKVTVVDKVDMNVVADRNITTDKRQPILSPFADQNEEWVKNI